MVKHILFLVKILERRERLALEIQYALAKAHKYLKIRDTGP